MIETYDCLDAKSLGPAHRKNGQGDEDGPEDEWISEQVDEMPSTTEHLASQIHGPMPWPRWNFALFGF